MQAFINYQNLKSGTLNLGFPDFPQLFPTLELATKNKLPNQSTYQIEFQLNEVLEAVMSAAHGDNTIQYYSVSVIGEYNDTRTTPLLD